VGVNMGRKVLVMSEENKEPKKGTITHLAKNLFAKNPNILSNTFVERIKKTFPDSKVNVYHYSWYKRHFNKRYGMNIPKNVGAKEKKRLRDEKKTREQVSKSVKDTKNTEDKKTLVKENKVTNEPKSSGSSYTKRKGRTSK